MVVVWITGELISAMVVRLLWRRYLNGAHVCISSMPLELEEKLACMGSSHDLKLLRGHMLKKMSVRKLGAGGSNPANANASS